MTDISAFLKELIALPGLSGHEGPVREVIARAWQPLVDELSTSRLGSLHGLRRGVGSDPRPRILLSAHMDAIGLMVTQVKDGFLRFTQIGGVDPRVSRVVDLKTPGSHEMARNRLQNLPLLTARDQVKFVLCDRADYEWACQALAEHRLAERCPVLVSPVDSTLNATTLAEWVLADRLPVRFQVQLHKRLWGNLRGK